jgi:AcrR family transcriptional regulator
MDSKGTSLTKGEETRAMILDAAVRLAAVAGYDALTIGALAEKTGMSKSGLFAHFGSKEELQLAALEEAVRRYNELAFLPAMTLPRGLARLRGSFTNWLQWTQKGQLMGCPMMAASAEFGHRESAMRDAVEMHMRRNHRAIIKGVELTISTGEFREDIDAEQVAFEIFGIVSTSYRAMHLFRDPLALARAEAAFERLVFDCSPAAKTHSRSTKHTSLTT